MVVHDNFSIYCKSSVRILFLNFIRKKILIDNHYKSIYEPVRVFWT